MINELEIKNFQSLEDVTLTLAPFTVIVGPSSSGKSALVRAVNTLASNRSGKDFITEGAQTTTIKARTHKGTVVLVKGKPEDSYTVLDAADIENPRKYTKLGVSVPPEVSTFLGIAPKDALNFAGQFDSPFLLRTSASEVARTLADLTNVRTIFAAAQEAVRLKLGFSSTLRTRQQDTMALTPKIEALSGLEEQERALAEAETRIEIVRSLMSRRDALNTAVATIRVARSRLDLAQQRTDVPLPSLDKVHELVSRKHALEDLRSRLMTAGSAITAARGRIEELDLLLSTTHEEYNRLLTAAGTCPTCGADTKDRHGHHDPLG